MNFLQSGSIFCRVLAIIVDIRAKEREYDMIAEVKIIGGRNVR